MSYTKYLLSICFLLLNISLLFAQPGGGIDDAEVEIVRDFEARLIESEKLVTNPSLPPIDDTPANLVYNIPSKSISLTYPPPSIRPVAMPRDKMPKAYKGYLKAGVGTPNSPYGEFGYFFSDKNLDIGTHLKHHSANYKQLEHQRFSESGGTLEGTYRMKEGLAVNAKVGHVRDAVHYYGYDHELDSARTQEQVRQIYNVTDLGIKVFNSERNYGDINYHAGVDFYILQDNRTVNETGVDIDLGATKWFGEKHPLTVLIGTDFTRLNDNPTDVTEEIQSLDNFFLKPSYTYHGDGFSVKAGANIISNNDKFTLYPDVEVNANVVGNQLAVYAGWNGDFQKNTLRSLSDYNPFVLTRRQDVLSNRLLIKNSTYNNYYGGVKGNLRVVDYQVQAGLKQVNDLALFLNDPTDTIKFNAVYDSVNIVNVEGTLNSSPIDGLNVIASLGWNLYNFKNDPSDLKRAWHLPALTFNLTASYLTLGDKLRLKGELFIENGVPFLDRQGTIGNLNGLFDLSFGAEYFIAKNFGAFLDVNNLASNNRERWYRYPTYGINVLGGITARF